MTVLKRNKQVTTEVYVVDGREYATLKEAEEADTAPGKAEEVIQETIRRGYGFAKDMDAATLRQMKGVWVIKDEGPIDFHSSASAHTLAYCAGTYEQAARYAVTIPGFRGYGWGKIDPIKIVDLTHT